MRHDLARRRTSVVPSAATPALALEAKKQIEVEATPAAAWAAIGEFCGIGELASGGREVRAEREGWRKVIRTLSLKGGGTIVEEQVGRRRRRA